MIFEFINSYEAVRYTANNRYHLVRLIFLLEPQNQQEISNILEHPTIYGKNNDNRFVNKIFEIKRYPNSRLFLF